MSKRCHSGASPFLSPPFLLQRRHILSTRFVATAAAVAAASDYLASWPGRRRDKRGRFRQFAIVAFAHFGWYRSQVLQDRRLWLVCEGTLGSPMPWHFLCVKLVVCVCALEGATISVFRLLTVHSSLLASRTMPLRKGLPCTFAPPALGTKRLSHEAAAAEERFCKHQKLRKSSAAPLYLGLASRASHSVHSRCRERPTRGARDDGDEEEGGRR